MFAFADGSRLTIILPVVACVFVSFRAGCCCFVLFYCVRLLCFVRVMVVPVGAGARLYDS